jgi:hypothetical protein
MAAVEFYQQDLPLRQYFMSKMHEILSNPDHIPVLTGVKPTAATSRAVRSTIRCMEQARAEQDPDWFKNY